MRRHLLAGLAILLLSACDSSQNSADPVSGRKQVELAALTGFPDAIKEKYGRVARAKSADLDTDGDGISDSEDIFPLDPGEFLDSDENGVGNFAQKDEDLDGINDFLDAFPFDPTRSALPVFTEIEPNNAASSASIPAQGYPIRIRGTLSGPSDVDFIERPLPTSEHFVAVTNYMATSSSTVKLGLIAANGVDATIVDRAWARPSNPVEASIFHATISAVQYNTYSPELNHLRVSADVGATFPQDYEILVFEDRDTDLVPDEWEKAVGARSGAMHSAETRIPDFVKFYVAVRSITAGDVDGDNIPDWLDLDSDGDLFPDLIEGYDDVDEDGLPNYGDLDSDGNNIADAIECAAASGVCIDSDGDGLTNWRDRDDDADGIFDENDANRLVPAVSVSGFAAGRPGLFGAHSIASDGKMVIGVARSGNILVLNGASLESFGVNPIVSFSSATKAGMKGRELRNIRGEFVNGNLQVPFVWGAISAARVFVTDGTAVSEAIPILALPQSAPLISQVTAVAGTNSVQLVIKGDQIPPDATLLVDGSNVAVTARSASTQITALLPYEMKEGVVQLVNASSVSNEFPYRVSLGKKVRVQYPSGYTFAYSNLKVASESLTEAVPSALGQADITVETQCALIVASGLPVQDQATMSFSAFIAPADYLPPMNAETTAISYAFITLLANGSVTLDEICSLRSQAAALPAIQSLKNLIENRLVISRDLPNLTRVINLAYLKAAANAAATLVQQNRPTAFAMSKMQAKSIEEYKPIITPETQHDVTLVATKALGDAKYNGKINFDNDTRVFFSSQAIRTGTNIIVSPHVTSWLDPLMVQPQSGMINMFTPYKAGERLEAIDIDFADVDVELMKSLSGMTSSEAATYAATRTIFQQVLTPWMSAIFGLPKHSAFEIASAVLTYYPATYSALKAAIANKNYAQAQNILLNQISDDIRSIGPLTRFIAAEIGRSAGTLAQVLITRFTPYVNGVLLAADLGGAAADTAVTLKDMATIPGRLSYKVEWPMWIESTAVTTNPSDAVTMSNLLQINGYGFRTKNVQGLDTNLRLKAVWNGGATYIIEPSKVSDNGTTLIINANEPVWAMNFGPIAPAMNDTLDIEVRKDTGDISVPYAYSNTKSFVYKIATALGSCPALGWGTGELTSMGWEYLWLPQNMRTIASLNLSISGCAVHSVRDGY